jgi:hypothetical protein
MLIAELGKRYLDHELMNALGIVFPQYWLQHNYDQFFPLHMKTLQQYFYVIQSVSKGDANKLVARLIQAPPGFLHLGLLDELV